MFATPSVSSPTRPDRLTSAATHYVHCELCEHRCGVNRHVSASGKCHADAVPRVFRQRVEYGDESVIAPSHLFYLSGCDLRCVYCINELNAFDSKRGTPLTVESFRADLQASAHLQPRTLQWVGGEPTIHLPGILAVLDAVPDRPRVVWKTDLHGTPQAYELLDGVVETYLADYKFGNDVCAQAIGGVPRYTEILQRNLLIVNAQTELIIRHLLLPGHLECCFVPIVNWIRDHLPNVAFSLREGYLPHWQAQHHGSLAQPLTRRAIRDARQIATDAGLRCIT